MATRFAFVIIRSVLTQRAMDTRPRITIVLDHFDTDLSGTENQLVKLIAGLREHVSMEVVIFRPNSWIDTRKSALGCPVTVVPIDDFRSLSTYRNIGTLIRHLRRRKPDIVHTFFPVANIIGVLAARCAGVPRIIGSRRDYGEWMSRRYLVATRFANWFTCRIVSNSEEVKRLTIRVERYAPERIHVIHNGVDAQQFARVAPKLDLKRRLGIPESNKVVGIVANFRPMKHHSTFVHAAHELLERRADVSFLMIGRELFSGLRRSTQKLVASLGIEHAVKFAEASNQEALREYHSIFDVGVNCSQGEGLSNAIMEYMCAGIPCIAARSGGNPDLIINDVTGLLFELDDAHQLAVGIALLIDDPKRAGHLAANALARIRKEMSVETMIQRFRIFYDDLVRGGEPQRDGLANVPGAAARELDTGDPRG